jgi:hypothetical protein
VLQTAHVDGLGFGSLHECIGMGRFAAPVIATKAWQGGRARLS